MNTLRYSQDYWYGKYFVFAFVFALIFLISFIAFAQSNASSQEHRSDISKVVAGLTRIAGQAQNIGQEVSQIAKEQEDSINKVGDAMDVIEARSGFKTFLIGTDYKNIGIIRSELVKTQNAIDRLTKAVARATSADVKTALEKQIADLEASKLKVETFVNSHESQFSIFGWFVKLFNK